MTRTADTQVERLVQYLRIHPGASGMEIITALALPKYTSRISDARAQGIDIVCEKRSDGRNGYRVNEQHVHQWRSWDPENPDELWRSCHCGVVSAVTV